MERLASFISGGGTTMREIVKAVQSDEIPDTEIACIIASKADAGGIEKARALGVPEKDIIVIDQRAFRVAPDSKKIDRERFGERILEVLGERGVTVVTQNGWLPITPANVIEAYSKKIFNQHPGPPEQFGGQGMMGKAVHATVLKFQELAGRVFDTAVVGHFSAVGLDEGSVVKRRSVPVLPGDTVDSLQERALPIEHRVQIEMLQDFARGQLTVLEPQILVAEEEMPLLKAAKEYARGKYPNG